MSAEEPIKNIKTMIAITLQHTTSQLGFIPDKHGDMVRDIIAGEDLALIMALGMYLDKCRAEESYTLLDKLQKEIEERDCERR